MTFLLGIFQASRGLQVAVLVFALWGAFEANNALQRHRGRSEAIATVTTAIEKKETADVAVSDEVRAEVARGKPGLPDDPNRIRVRDPAKDRPRK